MHQVQVAFDEVVKWYIDNDVSKGIHKEFGLMARPKGGQHIVWKEARLVVTINKNVKTLELKLKTQVRDNEKQKGFSPHFTNITFTTGWEDVVLNEYNLSLPAWITRELKRLTE